MQSTHKAFPVSRGLWLFHITGDAAELQNLETGMCLEIRPDVESGDGSFSLCRFDSPSCDEESDGVVDGCDVASGLSREGAFRLLHQLAERVGALDLKDFQEMS